ncbi:MAG TPA: hypothetical protein EYP56_11440 [Planctomycetaceae bacterium]|nr:hypothetical protein [Planctomycetaceae bacterium]
MNDSSMSRRQWLASAAAGVGTLVLGRAARGSVSAPMQIDEPFHGAVLNRRHGRVVEGGLEITVRGQAPLGDRVTVNGQPTRREGTRFAAQVVLPQTETDIVAVSDGRFGRREHRIRVVWDRYSEPRYRFSIDDNSFFLRDIAGKKYDSLFDCFYLKILRDLHARYGARFVLNIYYTTGDDFNLTQFPDRYRGEWEDNADWLKLAFHAYANEPARPYQYASPSKLIADLDLVAEQILRFAGPEVYTPPTVIHWGMVQPASLPALAERGVRTLSGYFRQRGGVWDVNYLLDEVRSEYLSRHDALKDFPSGIVFSRVDIVCNNTPLDQIIPTLAPLAEDPNQAEIMDLFTHEQYFWPFYPNYVPDHAERLDRAIRWVTERGYKPVFFHEGLLGGRL